jgi:hypothetical protein
VCFADLSVRLHDGELRPIVKDMFVSNALQVTVLPETVASLYCYSGIMRSTFEKPIDEYIFNPSLENILRHLMSVAGYEGTPEFKFFPDEVLKSIPDSPTKREVGTLLDILDRLGDQYSFKTYTDFDSVVFMYIPDSKNVDQTSLFDASADIVLDTNNMRQNPKIGPAQLQVTSNLDPLIRPTSVLDVTKLLTVASSVNEETLKVAQDFLSGQVAGFTKYQTLTVRHRGSNYTSVWETTAMATSPSSGGTTMPTTNWWL